MYIGIQKNQIKVQNVIRIIFITVIITEKWSKSFEIFKTWKYYNIVMQYSRLIIKLLTKNHQNQNSA